MRKSVFFSYAREDGDQLYYIAQSIRSAGFISFFDRDIVGGQQWWDRLLTQIEECDVLVPVLSSSYLRSVPCRVEVSYAVALGKALVPLDMGGGTLFGAAFIEPIKAAQWITYNTENPTAAILQMIAAINNAEFAPSLPTGIERPPAPGLDVLSTTVRLVGSTEKLTETEQWAVVGELRAHMRGEHRGASKALLASFLARGDLLAAVHNDARAMLDELPEPPPAATGEKAAQPPTSSPVRSDHKPPENAPPENVPSAEITKLLRDARAQAQFEKETRTSGRPKKKTLDEIRKLEAASGVAQRVGDTPEIVDSLAPSSSRKRSMRLVLLGSACLLLGLILGVVPTQSSRFGDSCGSPFIPGTGVDRQYLWCEGPLQTRMTLAVVVLAIGTALVLVAVTSLGRRRQADPR